MVISINVYEFKENRQIKTNMFNKIINLCNISNCQVAIKKIQYIIDSQSQSIQRRKWNQIHPYQNLVQNAEDANYEFQIYFFSEVIVERRIKLIQSNDSKWMNQDVNVRIILNQKKSKSSAYWTRLIKIDWTKYINKNGEAELEIKGLDD
ncbi:unnamed protein product [Paramecium sonneborni]|uniref:Uncharacterized protein n=1 Tax=Paramecium sonneborni TaxID=65129 RepID=A0A8S1NVF7_9CILI|nr:unnamed protein product [Paramecium sonneborni]